MDNRDALFKQFYDDLFQRASSLVAKGKYHPPIVAGFTNAGMSCAFLTSKMSEDARAALLMSMAADAQYAAAALITEAWYIDTTGAPAEATNFLELANQGRLEEYPAKQEAIVITLLTATRQAIMVCPIDRAKGSMQQPLFRWTDEVRQGFFIGKYVRSPAEKLH